jgi:hypothetical protein
MYRNRTDLAILRIVRVGHPVVPVWGVVALLVSIGLGRPARAEPPAATGLLELYDALPPDSAVRIRVGDGQQFSVWVAGEGLHINGCSTRPVAQRRAGSSPQETDVGPHLVTWPSTAPTARRDLARRVTAEKPASPPTTLAPWL